MRSLTKAHSRKRAALVTATVSNLRGGRQRERRLYFLFLCTFFICLVPVFLFVCWTFFPLWVVSVYSHCWLFLGPRGFCDNVFVVVAVTYRCREDHRSQRLPDLPGFEPWPLRYRCRALTDWDGKTTGRWSLNWFMMYPGKMNYINFIYWNCRMKK